MKMNAFSVRTRTANVQLIHNQKWTTYFHNFFQTPTTLKMGQGHHTYESIKLNGGYIMQPFTIVSNSATAPTKKPTFRFLVSRLHAGNMSICSLKYMPYWWKSFCADLTHVYNNHTKFELKQVSTWWENTISNFTFLKLVWKYKNSID